MGSIKSFLEHESNDFGYWMELNNIPIKLDNNN